MSQNDLRFSDNRTTTDIIIAQKKKFARTDRDESLPTNMETNMLQIDSDVYINTAHIKSIDDPDPFLERISITMIGDQNGFAVAREFEKNVSAWLRANLEVTEAESLSDTEGECDITL